LRRRFTKDELIASFRPVREINTKLFERDYLLLLDYFSSAALPPVNAASVDVSAGAEYIK